MNRIYIFRVNYDWARREISDEIIKRATLRQGWGCSGLSFVQDGKKTTLDAWMNEYKKIWDESDSYITNRFFGLSRMLDIQHGDLVVIPKVPDWRQFVVADISQSYTFDDSGDLPWGNDFRHTFKLNTIKVFGYDSGDVPKRISSRFRAYQSPVNVVKNAELQNDIREIFLSEPSIETLGIEQIIDSRASIILHRHIKEILSMTPTDFEDIIIACLKDQGYTIISRNQWDGSGGDVDVVATFSMPIFGNYCDTSKLFIIQIKKKNGNDLDDRKGVMQLIRMKKEEYQNADMILITSAEHISDDALRLASESDVRIIYGIDVLRMIMSSTSKMRNSNNA